MHRGAFVAFILIACLTSCASTRDGGIVAQPPKLIFKEIWGYLLRGKEDALTGVEPFTHICYFSADVTDAGRITETVERPVIVREDGTRPEISLVITELSNAALAHFCLSPDYGVRPLLIGDICRVSQDFDGVQIDFEAVSADDAQSFWDFLQQLRNQLPVGKSLSVAMPARTAANADAYVYQKIAPFVDRMVIMAYDEHWSSSTPGPVASLPWCSAVLDYTQSVIDNAKIIMGLPLYGRAWQDKRLAKAMGFQNVQDLIAAKNVRTSYQSELGSFFEYSENVLVKVFYEDVRTLREKLQLYQSRNVTSVAFWRVGLGSTDLWNGVGNQAQTEAPAGSQE